MLKQQYQHDKDILLIIHLPEQAIINIKSDNIIRSTTIEFIINQIINNLN